MSFPAEKITVYRWLHGTKVGHHHTAEGDFDERRAEATQGVQHTGEASQLSGSKGHRRTMGHREPGPRRETCSVAHAHHSQADPAEGRWTGSTSVGQADQETHQTGHEEEEPEWTTSCIDS